MNEWMNQCKNAWMNEWMNEWMNQENVLPLGTGLDFDWMNESRNSITSRYGLTFFNERINE